MPNDLIVTPTIGGSYVYTANTAAAFQRKKVYPYLPAPPPHFVEFKKFLPEEALALDLNHQCQTIVDLYGDFVKGRRFDTMILGAPNGAIVNLAIAMGVPYLCSQFRIPVLVNSTKRDDLEPYVKIVQLLGKAWTSKYPWSSTGCLVDPIHDRMDMGVFAHIRSKFVDIPPAFRAFIEKHLNPKGTLLFVNTTYSWHKFRLGPHTYLQVGGLGEITPSEYLSGSERLDSFLALDDPNLKSGWNLPNYECMERPESEWGVEPELKGVVVDYCKQKGYDLLYLEHNHPAGFNLLAAHALHKKHTADNGECKGHVVNIFWALCPTLTLRARLISSWFTFTDRASLKIAEQQFRHLIKDFPEVPPKIILGYNWSNPRATILDIVPPKGWLGMLSKYVPYENIRIPGTLGLDRTDHDIFKYEDTLFEESKRHVGNVSSYNVTIDDLKSLPTLTSTA